MGRSRGCSGTARRRRVGLGLGVVELGRPLRGRVPSDDDDGGLNVSTVSSM